MTILLETSGGAIASSPAKWVVEEVGDDVGDEDERVILTRDTFKRRDTRYLDGAAGSADADLAGVNLARGPVVAALPEALAVRRPQLCKLALVGLQEPAVDFIEADFDGVESEESSAYTTY